MLRRIALVSFLLVFAGCGSRTLDLNVKLLTKSCPGKDGTTVDALASVSDLEFNVSGDGLDKPMDTVVKVKDGKVTIPGIPLGAKGQELTRIISVKAHFGSGGPVTAKGAAVVKMSSNETGPVTIPIFLHPVESFEYTADAGAPSKCTEMNKARAGHTATLLPDGRVLIVGGAEFDAVGGLTLQDSAEIFDPLTGKFTLVDPSKGPKLARLYQTATLLQDGRVLVAGGEISVDGQLQTARPTELFDPKTDAFHPGPLLNQGRARHAAVLAAGGVVVVAGGYADPANPLPLKSTEYWDPAKNASTFSVGPDLPEARSEACATTIRGGQVVVLAGGKTVDGTGKIAATDQIAFLHDDNGIISLLTDKQSGAPVTFQMGQARYDLGCGALQAPDGSGGTKDVVALAGGFQTVDKYDSSSVSASVEIFDPASGVANAGSLAAGARGNLCAVQVDPKTLVFIGGYNSDDDSVATGSEQMSIGSNGAAKIHKTAGAPMNDGRFLHQCTRLADGSILVTGGMLDKPRKAGDPLSLRTAELYTPLTE